MAEETKINMTVTGEKVLFGKAFHILEEKTKTFFRTDSLRAFLGFVGTGKVIYFTQNTMEAVDPQAKVEKGFGPFAHLVLDNHPCLVTLAKFNNKKMNINELESFLDDVKDYMSGKELLQLIDASKNLEFSKTKSVIRQKDNMGNFIFTLKSEAGKQDFKFPETFTVTCPLFLGVESDAEFKFDFRFSYEEKDETCALFFKIKNAFLEDLIKSKKREILEGYLKDTGCATHWGQLSVSTQTDEWKYKDNGIIL